MPADAEGRVAQYDYGSNTAPREYSARINRSVKSKIEKRCVPGFLYC